MRLVKFNVRHVRGQAPPILVNHANLTNSMIY